MGNSPNKKNNAQFAALLLNFKIDLNDFLWNIDSGSRVFFLSTKVERPDFSIEHRQMFCRGVVSPQGLVGIYRQKLDLVS